MAVSNTSGVAGFLDLGSRGGQPGTPLEGFAQQLLQAKELQRQSDTANLSAAMAIAEHDPHLAEEIGGKALKGLQKGKGQTSSEMLFGSIFEQAKKQRELGVSKEEAGIAAQKAATEASQASTQASQATTKAETQRQAGLQFTQQHEQQYADMLKRFNATDYPDTPEGEKQRITDAATIESEAALLGKPLSEDQLSRMEMGPKATAEKNKMVKANMKSAAYMQGLQIADQISKLGVSDDEQMKKLNEAVEKGDYAKIPKLNTETHQKFVKEMAEINLRMEQARRSITAEKAAAGLYEAQTADVKSQAAYRDAQTKLLEKRTELLGTEEMTPEKLKMAAEVLRDSALAISEAKKGGIKVDDALKDFNSLYSTVLQATHGLVSGVDAKATTPGDKAANIRPTTEGMPQLPPLPDVDRGAQPVGGPEITPGSAGPLDLQDYFNQLIGR